MFHFYLTLAYIIPNIYVFFRLKNLFISKKYWRWYSFIYLLAASVYPISESISEKGFNNQFYLFISTLSGYLLPFFLYVFLFVLAFDIFILLNLKLKFISAEKRKTFFLRFCILRVALLDF